MIPVALTIAGSDPSGGAGVQADLKTFHQHRVYGTSVLTLLTVQNTRGIEGVQVLDPGFVLSQLDAVVSDIPPSAAKTGALGSSSMIEAIARRAADFDFPLVVDPVMTATDGTSLLDRDAPRALREALLPRAFLVTPNLAEAGALAGFEVVDRASMEEAARAIAALGARSVLVKGGHLEGEPVDLLWSEGRAVLLPSERIATRSTHGTGCVLSAAITARLARGEGLVEAVRGARVFVDRAIRSSPGLGGGWGPVDMHARVE